jgi:hypothetical protein
MTFVVVIVALVALFASQVPIEVWLVALASVKLPLNPLSLEVSSSWSPGTGLPEFSH